MNRALVLGCSHAAGSELGIDSYARANSYPALIATHLGYNVTNLGIPGGSNDAMFRLFLDHAQDYDIIVAAWSGLNRSECYYNNKSIPFAPGMSVEKELVGYYQQWCIYGTDDHLGRPNKIKNIIAMNSLAQVPVINCESFWPVWGYKWPDFCNWPLANEENFWDWSIKNGFSKTKSGHFELTAHQSYAKYVVENLKL